MIKIRSITTFLEPGWPLDGELLARAGAFNGAVREDVSAAGYAVQTSRLATTPFPDLVPDCTVPKVVEFARQLEAMAVGHGFEYVSIGPARPELPESYNLLPAVFDSTDVVFAAGHLATAETGISLAAVRACAQVIKDCAGLEVSGEPGAQPNGFGNLFFAALANVPPGSPFFPAAYHGGGPPAFALATEAAGLAVEAFSSAGSLAEARRNLISLMESHAGRLIAAIVPAVKRFDIRFAGIDMTLAPFPDERLSIGAALERLGVDALGLHGSLAAAAFLVDAIDRATYPKTGFNGLMLPVLEDATLARRASEGSLTIRDLLLYASVCGTGLDTIPLAGDASADQLAAILLDLAALSQRLQKPLTARLMPIPGKSAGEMTDFDFPFFANSRIMPIEGQGVSGLFAGNETFSLPPHGPAGTRVL